MKLRLQSNSIRLRLKRSEVERFARTGQVEEEIVFGSGANDRLHYVLKTAAVRCAEVSIQASRIVVLVPKDAAARWVSTDDISLKASQAVGDGGELVILVEKDLACLDGTDDQNADTFPNPLSGMAC